MTYFVVSREPRDSYFRFPEGSFAFDDIAEARAFCDTMQRRFPSLIFSVRNECNNSCDTYPLVAETV